MFAIIKTGGKQYKVAENDIIKVEKLDAEKGATVKLDNVLALSDGKALTVGEPTVDKAVVSAEVIEQEKDDKVIIFKKKRRHNYRRKLGHRQNVTLLRIMDVSGKGAVKKAPVAAKKKVESKVEESAPKKATKPETKETKPAASKKKETKAKADAPKAEEKKSEKKTETKDDK